MESLSRGFCAHTVAGSFTEAALEGWKSQWPRPTLQIVDLLRYPCVSTPQSPSRFYAAVSDSASLLWLVVPPGTEAEDSIVRFQLDIGCCITLEDYSIVTATNGLNVVVLLRATYSSNPLSLLGRPTFDPTRFPLSHRALTRQQFLMHRPDAGGQQPQGREIVLCDLLENPQCAVSSWWIALRILWRGEAYAVQRLRREGQRATAWVTRFIGVDVNGYAILCSLWTGSMEADTVGLADCVFLGPGSVVWGAGEEGVPLQLQFSARSVIRSVPQTQREALPLFLSTTVGALNTGRTTVRDIIAHSSVEQVVTLTGNVRQVDSGVYVNTKRGRVLRLVITVEDEEVSNICVDVTLWGNVAEGAVPMEGERWLFTNCVVRHFMQRKTVSSRSSTITMKVGPAPLATVALRRGLPPSAPDAAPPEESASEDASRESAETLRVHFVLCFRGASPTLPALARVQEVQLPLIHGACLRCKQTQWGRAEVSGVCGWCGSTSWWESLRLRIELSDSTEVVSATVHSAVAESLLEMSEAEFLLSTQPAALENAARNRLVGSPVLVWLLRHTMECEFTIVNAKHVNQKVCAPTLFSMIDDLLDTV